jgi:hypothetical protein
MEKTLSLKVSAAADESTFSFYFLFLSQFLYC